MFPAHELSQRFLTKHRDEQVLISLGDLATLQRMSIESLQLLQQTATHLHAYFQEHPENPEVFDLIEEIYILLDGEGMS